MTMMRNLLTLVLNFCTLRFAYFVSFCSVVNWKFCFTLVQLLVSEELFYLFHLLNVDVLQALALSACTTLVSVEPKLTIETRNHVMKVQFSLVSFLFDKYIIIGTNTTWLLL